MNLILNIYTDETLTKVKRTVEADKLKIPYRVAMTVAQSLESLELDDIEDTDIIKIVTANLDKVDKVVKATFGLTDSELDCVDVTDLGAVALEIYHWALDKIASIKGDEKN